MDVIYLGAYARTIRSRDSRRPFRDIVKRENIVVLYDAGDKAVERISTLVSVAIGVHAEPSPVYRDRSAL